MDDESNVISLDGRRKTQPDAKPADGAAAAALEPIPGQIIWLHCLTCGTFEFTELPVPGGRTHRACGTVVEEAVVDVDLRAEFTIAEMNRARLRELTELIQGQIERYEEYQRRLTTLAGVRPAPYAVEGDQAPPLPVAEIDALGMLVSQAMHNPRARFVKEPPGDKDKSPPAAPEPAKESKGREEPS